MIYVSPENVLVPHMLMIAQSVQQASPLERPEVKDLAIRIKNKSAVLFEVPSGVILTEVIEAEGTRRLNILEFYCPEFGAHARGITRDLQRLARDWGCDTIQTVAYSERLAELIIMLGGRIESISLVLDAEEKEDGLEEEIHDDLVGDEDLGTTDLDPARIDGSSGESDGSDQPASGERDLLPGTAHSAA